MKTETAQRLLNLAKDYAKTLAHYERRREREGDDEGARLTYFTRVGVEEAIAVAEAELRAQAAA